MYKINCLNPIAEVGMNVFTEAYEKVDNFADAQVAMVRSAAMHDMDLPEGLLVVARAGAGVNNIPLDNVRSGHRCFQHTGRQCQWC